MCTVIIHVPEDATAPMHVLAVRDEDPERPWDPPGPWWDDRPGVVGVHDRRAGGAWLAADSSRGRLAVLLNRADVLPQEVVAPSRGSVALDAVAGDVPAAGSSPQMHGFNLVDVDGGRARVSSWDGTAVRQGILTPGTHMIAHDDVDDQTTARVVRWLPAFAAAAPAADAADWFAPWLGLLRGSADAGPADDTAIVRDNRPHGYPTLSLLVCAATVRADAVDVHWAPLETPGIWNDLDWH
jgi:hypothetical protein